MAKGKAFLNSAVVLYFVICFEILRSALPRRVAPLPAQPPLAGDQPPAPRHS